MFNKKRATVGQREAVIVSGAGKISLKDTFECGQAFRYEKLCETGDYIEYMTVVRDKIITVGQKEAGELIFYDISDDDFGIASYYFALDVDFENIRQDILKRYNDEWLSDAAESAKGIFILRQDPWETLFSFIISQNNNIPRIRKIIRSIAAEYGENLAKKQGFTECPLRKAEGGICEQTCKNCGICYSFPTAKDILKNPEGLLPSHPGFRYKYLLDAAKRVESGESNLKEIAEKGSYEYTLSELKKILGVGDKVASCVALFGFGNLEAFPIDVWMRRAIDEYFGGKLDPLLLGPYAGVAQQYIFHYIRNINN